MTRNPCCGRGRARALSGWMARLTRAAEDGIAKREIDAGVDCKALGQLIISTIGRGAVDQQVGERPWDRWIRCGGICMNIWR